MYIWDALYGKIEFGPTLYRCMMAPEVQRLREVRLCNINSLCITGSSNTNRFEHSVGTAYLAALNINSAAQSHLKCDKKTKETFVIAALLHDVANGPFGHSYEYIMEKQGFIPEKGIGDILSFEGSGANKTETRYTPIFFGKLKTLKDILDEQQRQTIEEIIAGDHQLSNLISSQIDLDNIDNVFRMAYHMGLSFTKEAPICLAQNMYVVDGNVRFKKEAEPYLNEWFAVRKRVYKFLLLNPQEFAGKYMLTEAMDIFFECASKNMARDKEGKLVSIEWHYTDYRLMTELGSLTEVWLPRRTLLYDGVDNAIISKIAGYDNQEIQKKELQNYIQSLSLMTPIKDKGRSGNSNKIQLSNNYEYSFLNDTIRVSDRNMNFIICGEKLYKVVDSRYNPSQIVSRLMTGDLYDCLMILETADVGKYPEFLNYFSRINIETDLEARIRSEKEFSRLNIGIHPILDKNKTERQLSIKFENDLNATVIGDRSSCKLLIGVFLKNEPYGLSVGKTPLAKHREKLKNTIFDYFASYFENGAKTVPLYEEANEYGY